MIQSIERASAILRLLSGQRQRAGVADLARALGLSKATVHGILRTLQVEGLVEQDDESGKYQLGASLLQFGFRYLHANRLRSATLSVASALATETGEHVRVAKLHDRHALIVHHAVPSDSLDQSLSIGALAPLHATALGKALLTRQPELVSRLAESGLEQYTDVTVTAEADLRAELHECMVRGWAHDTGELGPGLASIAAPISIDPRTDSGAIGIEGPADRICVDGAPRPHLVGAVLESARVASRELGAIPWANSPAAR